MRDRINIIKYDVSTDMFGFKGKKEVDYYSCWCNYLCNSGKESWSNYTKDSIVVASFKVRRCKQLEAINSKEYFIKFKEKIYNILFIDDSNKDYLYIKAEVRS